MESHILETPDSRITKISGLWGLSDGKMEGMEFLRKFIVELIAVALIVGWAVTKFPDVVTPFIPFICLVVIWHLAWELFLKKRIQLIHRGGSPMLYAIVFLVAGGVSCIVVWGVRSGIITLEKAQHAESVGSVYIKLEGFEMLPDRSFILANFINTGETPAKNLLTQVQMVITDGEPEWHTFNPALVPAWSVGEVGIGDTFRSGVTSGKKENSQAFAHILDGTYKLYVVAQSLTSKREDVQQEDFVHSGIRD